MMPLMTEGSDGGFLLQRNLLHLGNDGGFTFRHLLSERLLGKHRNSALCPFP